MLITTDRVDTESSFFLMCLRCSFCNYCSTNFFHAFSKAVTCSHVEQAQPWHTVLFQQPLVRKLLAQLVNLRRRHLASIWGQLAVGLRPNRDYFVVRN